ncbi:Ubiquitin-like 1-activating enzyme E1A [Intoshia linei]|uniref:Ubiquitin-like 1-activating enzyme E1A n=1 Tax=Intoshia linei TaxID=1819745 RepID=A0A177BAT1_9BILA|nr:Ubiquitin-like 1-activating enzyme E1A [Intoshia linei]
MSDKVNINSFKNNINYYKEYEGCPPVNKTENKEEMDRYDRQIRLWGIQLQKRLKASNILVIGLNPLGADICKNLVLAGIETIDVYDDKVVTESDVNTNFLVDTVEDKTLMESVASKLSELNPHVKVTPEKQIKMVLETCLLNHKSEDEVDSCLNILRKYEVIVVSSLYMMTEHALQQLNLYCRIFHVGFYVANCFDYYGTIFTDFDIYSYIKLNDQDEEILKLIKYNRRDQISIEEWLKKNKSKRQYTQNAVFILEKVLSEINKELKISDLNNVELTEKIKTIILRDYNEYKDFFNEHLFQRLINIFRNFIITMVSICSIVGGILSADVIKFISKSDSVIHNFFVFNGITRTGTIFHIA